ncbi:MAG TPA: endonuclease [Thermoplasmatales archaeon]|nr:endonuclease [Thermoplasmatales archaeon]
MNTIELYRKLLAKLGPQGWWPFDEEYHRINNSDARFEIIVGAILTQNTAWENVKKAIDNLKKERLLSIDGINKVKLEFLEELIRPSGYYHQKAIRLKNLASYLVENYNSNLDVLFEKELYDLRRELLELKGIGRETADSILLYAGSKPIFVVDAYTMRLCNHIPLYISDSYDDVQRFFQDNLKSFFKDEEKLVDVYKELHALIVYLGKTWCRVKPICNTCPIREDCNYYTS